MKAVSKASVLATLLLLAACATTGGAPMDMRDADVEKRVEANGDTVEEFRVSGQLRMVRITPVRGPAYYLYDRDGTGRFTSDRSRDDVSPVYWKLYGW